MYTLVYVCSQIHEILIPCSFKTVTYKVCVELISALCYIRWLF